MTQIKKKRQVIFLLLKENKITLLHLVNYYNVYFEPLVIKDMVVEDFDDFYKTEHKTMITRIAFIRLVFRNAFRFETQVAK